MPTIDRGKWLAFDIQRGAMRGLRLGMGWPTTQYCGALEYGLGDKAANPTPYG
jgi:hypothetical protein